jgi:hypothetical protein
VYRRAAASHTVDPQQADLLSLSLMHHANGILIDDAHHFPDKLGMREKGRQDDTQQQGTNKKAKITWQGCH